MHNPGDASNRRLFHLIPFRIFFPVALTVALFVTTIFLLILPMLENYLMAGKRETIRSLTEVACSAVGAFEEKERSGLLSGERARSMAMEHLRRLRHGPESKDYFWVNDLGPSMIMHPYRTDLEGRDVSDFIDPDGKRIFVECVDAVKARGAGFVDYRWQWKDDPDRIVPKISYVKGFEPWGWIIGTGIYVEDVRAEIGFITRKLTLVCFGILVVILGLSAYILWQGAAAEKRTRFHQEQLFQADKMATLGALVSGVAHEINNPIMSIMLNAPILEKAWSSAAPILDNVCREEGDFTVGGMPYSMLRERMPLLLADIADGARRVKSIVSDLKDFARQDPGEMNDDVDLNATAGKAATLVANLIKKSTHHFTAEHEPGLPTFRGSAQRIEQVIINLLVNACHALPDNQRALGLITKFDADAGRVVLEVRDQGAGMAPGVLKRIKDPFFTTKRDDGGTGLGLSISDRIVRDHGGFLAFASTPGKGTTCRVSIPVERR
ncbi:MAG: two component system sensor protein [Desulfobacterales bacterium]|nr:two component system sensor protein [Desulfobacterales bacterium]